MSNRVGRALPKNVSKAIPCDQPGYEGTEVTFIISCTQGQLEEVEGKPFEMAALIVNEFPLWPFDVPRPEHGNVKSFEQNCPFDLAIWLQQVGYQKGMQSAFSPN